MQNYAKIRAELAADTLLCIRLGNFYELFNDDAETAASILNLALTKRNSIPVCGFPHHSAKHYIGMLVAAGKGVALAERHEPAKS